MQHPWRIGIVGLGFIGLRHARLLSALPGVHVPAGCDVAPDRVRDRLAKADLSDFHLYSSLTDMLANEDLDAVTICTASGSHMAPALQAIDHGLNVIVEKPIEISTQRIDRMIEAADRMGVRLAGVFQNRYTDAARALKAAVDEGRFGRMAWAGALTPWYRDDQYYAAGGWRGTWQLDGGGAMMNQSIHAVDLLQWLAGPIRRVSAFWAKRIHPQIEVEDTLTASLQFAGGACGSIVGTTAAYPGGNVRLEIGGEDGTAVLEDGLRKFAFRQARPDDETLLRTTGSGRSGGGAWAADIDEALHVRSLQAVLWAWENGVDADRPGDVPGRGGAG